MSVPKRPNHADHRTATWHDGVTPVVVDGASLRRSCVAPDPSAEIHLGDIVEDDGHRWDVAGYDQLLPRLAGGTLPTHRLLERIVRPAGQEGGA